MFVIRLPAGLPLNLFPLLVFICGTIATTFVLVAALIWSRHARSAFCRLGAFIDHLVYGEGREVYDVRGLILPWYFERRSSTWSTRERAWPLQLPTWGSIAIGAVGVTACFLVRDVDQLGGLLMAMATGCTGAAFLWLMSRPSLPDFHQGGAILFPRRNRMLRWLASRVPLFEPIAYSRILRQLARDYHFPCARDFLQATLNTDTSSKGRLNVERVWGMLFIAPDMVVSGKTLDTWARESDDLADAALSEVIEAQSKEPGLPQDYLEAIPLLARRPGFLGCNSFWESCTSLPPPESGPCPLASGSGRPNPRIWTDSEKEAIEAGQKTFFRYATALLTSMLHASLVAGFALPRMVRVLETTGYLLGRRGAAPQTDGERSRPTQEDKTWDRLMHTTGWVVDTMLGGSNGLLPPQPLPEGAWTEGGKGWKAIVKVRLIHARVRRFVISHPDGSSGPLNGRGFDVSRDGVPINQADMAATLGAFCAMPLLASAHMGLNIPGEQAEAFVAVWRVIGFYSGVRPDIVQRYFSSAPSSQAFTVLAGVRLASLPLLPPDPSIPEGASIAVRLLRAVANRPPSRLSLDAHIAIVRYLVGPELSDTLGLPLVPPGVQRGSEWVFKALVTLPPTVGRWHRRAFEQKRLTLARLLIPALFQTHGAAARKKLGAHHSAIESLGPPATFGNGPDWPAIRRLHLEVTLEMIAVVVVVVTIPLWVSAAILLARSFTLAP